MVRSSMLELLLLLELELEDGLGESASSEDGPGESAEDGPGASSSSSSSSSAEDGLGASASEDGLGASAASSFDLKPFARPPRLVIPPKLLRLPKSDKENLEPFGLWDGLSVLDGDELGVSADDGLLAPPPPRSSFKSLDKLFNLEKDENNESCAVTLAT